MLTFLVVIGASFAIMASILTGMVSSTLYQQRTRQATRSLEQLASSAAPFLASAQMDSLSELLTAQAGELGGRLLAVDMDGKVQADTFGARSGQRLSIPETVAVLLHGEKSAFGIHRVDLESGVSYVAVASAVMEVSGKTLGVLVLSLPVDELQTALETVKRQLMTVFLIVAGAAMAAALMLSGMLTRPVKALTQTIRRMGKGDLSARVNVRTSGELRELAESYNAMAEQIEHLDKSRSQFVANASHELKTPLATMKLLLENMLYQPDMPQELRTEFMQDINHEIDRLSGIITDLLTLTQMDSHSSHLRVTKVDLSALTEETVHTLQIAAEQKGQTLTADIAPGITLEGDSGKLMQIFYNLTDNAIKYTPENGISPCGLRKAAQTCCSPSQTTASASRRKTRSTFSSASTASIRRVPARRAERGWGFPSSGSWRRCTAARSACHPSRGRARRSPSPCRWMQSEVKRHEAASVDFASAPADDDADGLYTVRKFDGSALRDCRAAGGRNPPRGWRRCGSDRHIRPHLVSLWRRTNAGGGAADGFAIAE